MDLVKALYESLLVEIEFNKDRLDREEKYVNRSEEAYKSFLIALKDVKNFIKEKIDQKKHTLYQMRRIPQRYLKNIDKERLNLLKRIEILESKYVHTHR